VDSAILSIGRLMEAIDLTKGPPWADHHGRGATRCVRGYGGAVMGVQGAAAVRDPRCADSLRQSGSPRDNAMLVVARPSLDDLGSPAGLKAHRLPLHSVR